MVNESLLQKCGAFDGRNHDAIDDCEASKDYSIFGKHRESLHLHRIDDALIGHAYHMLYRIYYRHCQ